MLVLASARCLAMRHPSISPRSVLNGLVLCGEVAEWSKAPHSKCGVPVRVPRVRIPASPPASRSVQRSVAVSDEKRRGFAPIRSYAVAQRTQLASTNIIFPPRFSAPLGPSTVVSVERSFAVFPCITGNMNKFEPISHVHRSNYRARSTCWLLFSLCCGTGKINCVNSVKQIAKQRM